MMQSNAVNAMLLIPGNADISKSAKAKTASSSDNSFMNILKDRIANRKDSSSKGSPVETNNSLRKSDAIKNSIKTVNETEQKPQMQKLESEAKNTVEAKKPEGSKEKPESVNMKNESGQEEKIQEEISSIEAIIALLEELMARLDIKNFSVDASSLNDVTKWIESTKDKEVSPMELLMALMEGNTSKLTTIMNDLSGGQQASEVDGLMEKLQGLIEKLTGEQNATDSELKAEIIVESASKYDLINQLKAQCGQLIEKLTEQVTKLKANLPQEQDSVLQTEPVITAGIITEEAVAENSVVVESESKNESKDTEGDSAAHAKDTNIQDIKTISENENSFEDVIVQNQQMPKEILNNSVKLEKTQLPLTEKPLTHTVTNQVMMKVKLMAGENKQEMEMHLKPDSLGKLSLRIIHERGEILAKITAENQQVKEILESNMQMLKDALEKSGLTVQSLSVSVGNGNENGQNKGNGNEEGRARSAGLARAADTSSQINNDRLNLRMRIEKEYLGGNSQINLTA